MIIKHGGHIIRDILEVHKDMWAFFSWLCFTGADWLSPIMREGRRGEKGNKESGNI